MKKITTAAVQSFIDDDVPKPLQQPGHEQKPIGCGCMYTSLHDHTRTHVHENVQQHHTCIEVDKGASAQRCTVRLLCIIWL